MYSCKNAVKFINCKILIKFIVVFSDFANRFIVKSQLNQCLTHILYNSLENSNEFRKTNFTNIQKEIQ